MSEEDPFAEHEPGDLVPQPSSWRYHCPRCGRFIAGESIHDELDPIGSYFGVADVGTCTRCGDVKWPPCIPTRFVRADVAFPEWFAEDAAA